MVNYQNGKIYCLRSNQTDDIYIGSTAEERLSARMSKHRVDYNRWLNGKTNYVTSYELLKYDDCYIELIEKYPCKDKMELERREGEIQREMNCVNKYIAGRTYKEYYQDNRCKISEKSRQYRQDNKETISEYMKQYQQNNKEKLTEYYKQRYQDNKEKLSEYYKQHYQDNKGKILEYQKQYRQDNKETISEYMKQYQQNNREELSEYYKQKMTCVCGSTVSKRNLSTHKKSKKHIDYMNSQKK